MSNLEREPDAELTDDAHPVGSGSDPALYFDRDGNPLPGTLREQTLEWARLRSDHDYCVIGHEDVLLPSGRAVWVSTVWLGLDHSFGFGPPVVFETMIFENGMADIYCQRYATATDAEQGHRSLVQMLKDGLYEPERQHDE